MIACRNCGAVRPNGTQFCPNCGSPSSAAVASSGSSGLPKVGIPLATLILGALGVFFIASSQYGGSHWQWYGFSPAHHYFFVGKIAFFEAALGYLLLVIGWGISTKYLVAKIGLGAYIIALLAFIAPIAVLFLAAIQCSWDGSYFYVGAVWEKNWFAIVMTMSYEFLAAAILIGGLVARSRSRREPA